MSSTPFVSVIMNCYNSEKYLKEAIQSVFAQSYSNWEIIFWDNCSTDQSAQIAQSFGPKLKYFRGEKNVPLGEARNLALSKASGDLIAFLDCDDLWMPEKLNKQVTLFADPQVGLVYSDALYFNENNDSHRLYQNRAYYTGECFSQLLTDYFLCLQTVVIRKLALQSLSAWFDPAFQMSEEADLFTRIGYSWKLAMVHEPLAKWRVHSSSATWQQGHLFSDELNAMLLKYQKLIPHFAQNYAREIVLLQRQTILSKAMFLWRAGKNQGARQTLWPLLKKPSKAWLVYGATFFPERSVRKFLAPFRKTRVNPSEE